MWIYKCLSPRISEHLQTSPVNENKIENIVIAKKYTFSNNVTLQINTGLHQLEIFTYLKWSWNCIQQKDNKY